jgi:hypothetical protein
MSSFLLQMDSLQEKNPSLPNTPPHPVMASKRNLLLLKATGVTGEFVLKNGKVVCSQKRSMSKMNVISLSSVSSLEGNSFSQILEGREREREKRKIVMMTMNKKGEQRNQQL